jgi:hypothetical protein
VLALVPERYDPIVRTESELHKCVVLRVIHRSVGKGNSASKEGVQRDWSVNSYTYTKLGTLVRVSVPVNPEKLHLIVKSSGIAIHVVIFCFMRANLAKNPQMAP